MKIVFKDIRKYNKKLRITKKNLRKTKKNLRTTAPCKEIHHLLSFLVCAKDSAVFGRRFGRIAHANLFNTTTWKGVSVKHVVMYDYT